MAEELLSDDELDLTVEGESDPSPGGEETEEGQPADDGGLESPPTGRRDAGDDDDAAWSEKVKKRIGKEVYRRKAAEEREGQLSADIAALRAEIDQLKSHNADAAARATDGELQGKLASARQRLKQAIEDADTDAQLAAQEALADAKIELREAAARQKRADGDDRQGGGRPPAAPANPTMAAGAAAWLAGDSWPELPWWVASTVMLSGFSLLWRRRKAKQLVAALPDADIGQAVQVVLWRDEQHARVRYRGTEWEARLVEGERLGQGHESYLIVGRDGHEWLLRCQTKPTNEANSNE